MIDSNQLQSLHEGLINYFHNDEFEINDAISKTLYSLILEGVDCDYDKLISAITLLAEIKDIKSNLSFQEEGNIFDISKSNDEKCFVKGFLSNSGYPILYFFTNNQRLPDFKIKSYKNQKTNGYSIKVERSESPEILATYKHTLENEKSYFLRICDINFDKNGFEFIDGMQAKTDTKTEEKIEPDVLCDQYKNFYAFLQGVLKKNKVDSLDNLTPTKFDVLYSIFFQKMKNLTNFNDELNFDDMVLLMNLVFNQDKTSTVEHSRSKDGTIQIGKFSPMVSGILAEDIKPEEHKSFEYSYVDPETGKNLSIYVVRAMGYMSLDMFEDASRKKPKASYLFGATNNGFTLFRGLRDYTSSSNPARVFTLNLSDDMFRLSIKKDARDNLGSSEDLVLKFLPDGELAISSVTYQDVKYDNQIINENENQQKQVF